VVVGHQRHRCGVRFRATTFEHFERVGHSVLALLIALLTGLWARYVFGRRSLTVFGWSNYNLTY
jgi:hypothetical protein